MQTDLESWSTTLFEGEQDSTGKTIMFVPPIPRANRGKLTTLTEIT
jgi:hypothetical protein